MKNISEKILINVPSPILAADLNQKIVFLNVAFEAVIGKNAQDLIGNSLNEALKQVKGQWEFLVEEFSRPLSITELEKNQAHKNYVPTNNYERDPLVAQPSGAMNFNPPSVVTLNEEIYTYQIFDAGISQSGDPLRGLILNDITEEKAFLDRMTQAENISSLKTLVAGISHEISNPLHSILTFSEAITQENDLEKIKSYAGKVVDNSTRLGKVLVDFSGYVQSKKDGNKNKLNIIDSIKAALKFAMLPYPNHKIDLREDFEELPNFMADAEELQQIFFNIFNNALQAVDGSGQLNVSTRKNKKFIEIIIEDNGPGMPREILRKVFNPFFSTKMQGKGTGLGLNITQRLVEKYAGKIEIHSKEGEGTKVSIYFPNVSGN